MGRWAIIRAGAVVNVVEAEDADRAMIGAPQGATAVPSGSANPGDDYSGGQFVAPAQVVPVPEVVSKYQFIEACDDVLNVTQAQIDATLAGMAAGRAKRRMLAWWTCSASLSRRGARMNDLQALMGWSNAQVRQVFVAAAAVGD